MPVQDSSSLAASEACTARTVTRGGVERLFFGGCSYLGLAQHSAVVAAASSALARFGVSAGAARGTSGTCVEHEALEAELAAFAGAEACALFPDAALADLGLALARLARGARVWTTADAHPAIQDALRMVGAVATTEVAPEDADAAFVDGTFPSAGRTTEPLALARLPFAAIDDAHGFGVLGERGAGAAEALDLRSDRHALVVSLSKALGCQGGAVLGSARTVADVRHTSPYACTTALSPAAAAAGRASLRVLQEEPERRARCLANARRLHALVDGLQPRGHEVLFPVRALSLGSATAGVREHLARHGIEVPLVRYPGGPTASYLRFAVTAAHGDADLDRLEQALGAWAS